MLDIIPVARSTPARASQGDAFKSRVTERRAVELIHAAGTGVVLILLSTPLESRDPGLADAMYEAVARSILTDAPALPTGDPAGMAVAIRAVAPTLPMLTAAERTLLSEWLDRA